jgi:nicotinamide-nucleotide amidase
MPIAQPRDQDRAESYPEPMHELQSIAEDIAAAAQAGGHTVAAAESVTAGQVATALAAAGEASEWFSGSIVAYRTATKRDLLGVESETIISHRCAREMAEGVLRLTGADLVVSITGVGGPDPEEGKPAGTVIICTGGNGDLQTFDHAFEGPPDEVVRSATAQALRHLRDAALARRGKVA